MKTPAQSFYYLMHKLNNSATQTPPYYLNNIRNKLIHICETKSLILTHDFPSHICIRILQKLQTELK